MNQYQEFLLQGSVLDSSKDLLIDRMRGLTDIPSQSFCEHELVLSIKRIVATPITIHVRRTLESNKEQTPPWLIRYISPLEPDLARKWPTLVRKSVDVLAHSDNMMNFFKELGFTLDYEYITKGEMFVKGRVKVTISKIFRLQEPGNPKGGQEPMTESHFVEVSVIAPYGQDALAHECKAIADQLRPIVNLEKIDHAQLLKSTA